MLINFFTRRRTSPDEYRRQEFIEEYNALSERLHQIRSNYDFVSEDAEIDALIYEENAVLCRLSSMYSRAREMGIHIDFQERISKE